MSYGTVMGGYWILKFLLVPVMFSFALAPMLFLVLTVAVPFLGYFMTRRYRDRDCPDGWVSFMQAWIFCLSMYLFAALLVSVAHYIFFRYGNADTLIATYNSLLEGVAQADPAFTDTVTQYKEAMSAIAALSPIELTVQMISSNIFYGTLFSLPTALLVALSRKRKEETQS